ncbi:MAG TPA: TonB-dependent receptor family protein [Lacibacter sp.]|nr:TonB-dependent receptor family protein [Lacibacter sp.]
MTHRVLPHLFLGFLGLFAASRVAAQQGPGLLTANVLDAASQNALAQATVVLQSMADTSRMQQALTDKNGSFQFENIGFGYYRLRISAVGYRQYQLDSIHFRTERYDFNLGDLLLSNQSLHLQEVVVYAEKPLIESKEGNIIFNAGESALSNGSSAAELLKQTPLVTVDPDGKILVRGKEPRILVDDKPVALTLQQLQDMLESMPGSNVDRIEVLTNPPPQYANEQGGVINIVTRKGKIGMGGRVNLSGGTRGEVGGSASLNYRRKGLAINLSTGAAFNRFTGDGYSSRTNFFRDSTNRLLITNAFQNENTRPNHRVNVDYDFNKRTAVNLVAQHNANLYGNESLNRYTNRNRFDAISRLSERTTGTEGSNRSANVNITFTRKGTRPGELFRWIQQMNTGSIHNERDFFQEFLTPEGLRTGTDSTQQQLTRTRNNGFSSNLSYDRQLGNKKTNWSTGAAYNRTNSDVTLVTEFLKKPDNTFFKVDLLSNRFRFHQDVINLRSSFKHVFKPGFSVSAGASVEQTNILFELLDQKSTVYNRYINWLPFANFNRSWANKTTLSFSYRRTIRRPGINELNPSVDYSDPYNIRFGNPGLQPTLAHTFDLVAGKTKQKFFFNAGLGYNQVENIFASIRTLQPDGKTIVTWDNVSSRQEYEMSAWGGVTISKKLRGNLSTGYTYNVYSAFDKTVRRFRDGGSFTSNLNGNFTPTDVWTFTLNGTFNRFANPQGTVRSNVNMNLGVQRKLLKKKIILTFNAVDPFISRQNRFFTEGTNFQLESFSRTSTTNYRLTISYQFSRSVSARKAGLPGVKPDNSKK